MQGAAAQVKERMEVVAKGGDRRPVLLFPEVQSTPTPLPPPSQHLLSGKGMRVKLSDEAHSICEHFGELCILKGLRLKADVAGVQGTTTNGKLVLPFKTGAFLAGVPVQVGQIPSSVAHLNTIQAPPLRFL